MPYGFVFWSYVSYGGACPLQRLGFVRKYICPEIGLVCGCCSCILSFSTNLNASLWPKVLMTPVTFSSLLTLPGHCCAFSHGSFSAVFLPRLLTCSTAGTQTINMWCCRVLRLLSVQHTPLFIVCVAFPIVVLFQLQQCGSREQSTVVNLNPCYVFPMGLHFYEQMFSAQENLAGVAEGKVLQHVTQTQTQSPEYLHLCHEVMSVSSCDI